MPPRTRPPDIRLAVGIDLIAIARVARLLEDHPAAARDLFTEVELAYTRGKRRPEDHLAGGFAAKEAVLKALGTGLARRMDWTDVEIAHEAGGRPIVRLSGEVEAEARRSSVSQVEVSIAHSGGFAVAHAVVIRSAIPRSAVAG